jgi:hypothetical protein
VRSDRSSRRGCGADDLMPLDPSRGLACLRTRDSPRRAA